LFPGKKKFRKLLIVALLELALTTTLARVVLLSNYVNSAKRGQLSPPVVDGAGIGK
jgi:hypothetical protein